MRGPVARKRAFVESAAHQNALLDLNARQAIRAPSQLVPHPGEAVAAPCNIMAERYRVKALPTGSDSILETFDVEA
ncbi:hypothetical protein [Altererythrobacter aquiaggeris]|uniref:hypothetical protein n=1 Tax=Aestuarierythrobacter aquiaggeris TaxID=1898396 RepID=UPI00301B3192